MNLATNSIHEPSACAKLSARGRELWSSNDVTTDANHKLIRDVLRADEDMSADDVYGMLVGRPAYLTEGFEPPPDEDLHRQIAMSIQAVKRAKNEARIRDGVLQAYGMVSDPVRHAAGERHPTEAVVTFFSYGGTFDMTVSDALKPERFATAFYACAGLFPADVDTTVTVQKWRQQIEQLLNRAQESDGTVPPASLMPALDVMNSLLRERCTACKTPVDDDAAVEMLDGGRVVLVDNASLYMAGFAPMRAASAPSKKSKRSCYAFSLGDILPVLMQRCPPSMLFGFGYPKALQHAGWKEGTYRVRSAAGLITNNIRVFWRYSETFSPRSLR